MGRSVLCLVLALALRTVTVGAQPVVSDPEVAKGIRLTEDGEYDSAILTLDSAARRLSTDAKNATDLSQAYLHLGIAYLGTGHETLAKARFRDALTQDGSLSLSPEKYAPRVLESFEKAREEIGRSAHAAPSAAVTPKTGRSKTGLILLGAGGAAAAGIAVVATGGGEETIAPTTRTDAGSVTNPDNRQDPTTSSQDPRLRAFLYTPRASGVLEATVSWDAGDATLDLYLWRGQPTATTTHIARSVSMGATTALLTSNVTAEPHQINVIYSRCRIAPCPPASFTLTVRHP